MRRCSVPQSLALIAANFPKDIRGRAIGTWAAASAMTTSLGPPIGGFLIDTLSWRVAFWINLPLAAVALWLTLRHVPESRDEAATGPVDWLGASLATLGFGAVTYGLIGLEAAGTARLIAVAAIVAGIVLLVLFVMVERRATNPVMPLSLFASRVFSGANIVTVLLYGALAGALFLLPFDLVVRRGLTAAEAGLTILPFGIVIGVMSRFMGGLADAHGPRPFMTLGPFLFALGAAWLALDAAGLLAGRHDPGAPPRGRHGRHRLAAHHRGDERGADRAFRRGVGDQQRREPACRRLRRCAHRACGKPRLPRLRSAGGAALRPAAGRGRSAPRRGRSRLRLGLCGGDGHRCRGGAARGGRGLGHDSGKGGEDAASP